MSGSVHQAVVQNAAQVAMAGGGATKSTKGTVLGLQVRHIESPTARLEDALEELTFSESERVESELKKRKVKTRSSIKSHLIEKINNYLRAVPDIEERVPLKRFVQLIREHGRGMSSRQMREEAGRHTKDSTLQFAALVLAKDQLREEGFAGEVVDRLSQAAAALGAEKESEITAGFNISVEAHKAHGEEIGTTQELRDFYREVVLDYPDIAGTHEMIATKFSQLALPQAIDFLLKGLAADLAASKTSIDKPHLKLVINDMYQLKSLNSMYDQCGKLAIRLQGKGEEGFEDFSGTPRELVASLVEFKKRGWQAGRFLASLPDQYGLSSPSAKVYFFTEFGKVVHELPLKLFDSDTHARQQLLTLMQTAVDREIAREEEE